MKKKKKKKKTPFDLEGALNEGGADEAPEEPTKEDNEDIDLETFGKKKKKKKKVLDDDEEKGDEEKDDSELLLYLWAMAATKRKRYAFFSVQ